MARAPQFVVAIQQVADGARGDGDAAPGQFAVDFGDAAVFRVAEAADQGENIEAELVVRQSEVRFGLWSVGPVEAFAGRVGAAANVQGEANDAVQRGHRAEVAVVVPELVEADGAMSGEGNQGLGMRGPRPCAGTWHGETSLGVCLPPFYAPEHSPTEFATLVFLRMRVAPLERNRATTPQFY